MAIASAEERVDGLFARLARQDAHVWPGVVREVDEHSLRRARAVALERADAAHRRDLLDRSLEAVERSYDRYLGDQGLWTGIVAVPVPGSASERTISRAIVEDLVVATVVEDLVSAETATTLRLDGDRLLRLSSDHVGLVDDDGAPPLDPFGNPFVAAGVIGTVVLTLAWFADIGLALVVAAVAVVVALGRRLRARS